MSLSFSWAPVESRATKTKGTLKQSAPAAAAAAVPAVAAPAAAAAAAADDDDDDIDLFDFGKDLFERFSFRIFSVLLRHVRMHMTRPFDLTLSSQ